MNRRDFIKWGTTALASLTLLKTKGEKNSFFSSLRIRIIHTNDTHSQIEPLPDNHPKYPGMGGYASRSSLIKMLRAEGYPTLLFDSGDVFQGTPYFNFYKGSLEFKLMSDMKYDAVALGNHEFDNGLDGLYEALKFAKFKFLSANYDFSKTKLKDVVLPYTIFRIKNIRIGVFALTVSPQGLIDPSLLGKVEYKDARTMAAYYAHLLKKKHKCQVVVLLSHLGLESSTYNIGDYDLAKESKNIQLILGGHSHTLLKKPIITTNSDGEKVIITQNGAYGVQLSVIDLDFNPLGALIGMNAYTNFLNKQV